MKLSSLIFIYSYYLEGPFKSLKFDEEGHHLIVSGLKLSLFDCRIFRYLDCNLVIISYKIGVGS